MDVDAMSDTDMRVRCRVPEGGPTRARTWDTLIMSQVL